MAKRLLDLDSVIPELERRKAKRIGIQIPDGLKYKSDQIVEFFEKKGYEVIISGTHTYGACDLDTELMKIVDVLIHIAHTPIFELDKVIYVPYYVDYDVEVFENLNLEERSIALIANAQYAWKLPDVKRVLEGRGYEVELRKGSNRVKMPGQVLGCNYTVLRGSKAEAVLFVGDGLFHPMGAKVYTGKKVYRFCPLDMEFEEVVVDDFLKKRYMSISKAMDGERGAIIVSKKIGQNRLNLALKLKEKARERGKRVNVVYLDDLSPDVLENFLYDYYVNTACPRISYDDIDLYGVPILTPQEFEILLGLRRDYEIDEIP